MNILSMPLRDAGFGKAWHWAMATPLYKARRFPIQ